MIVFSSEELNKSLPTFKCLKASLYSPALSRIENIPNSHLALIELLILTSFNKLLIQLKKISPGTQSILEEKSRNLTKDGSSVRILFIRFLASVFSPRINKMLQ